MGRSHFVAARVLLPEAEAVESQASDFLKSHVMEFATRHRAVFRSIVTHSDSPFGQVAPPESQYVTIQFYLDDATSEQLNIFSGELRVLVQSALAEQFNLPSNLRIEIDAPINPLRSFEFGRKGSAEAANQEIVTEAPDIFR